MKNILVILSVSCLILSCCSSSSKETNTSIRNEDESFYRSARIKIVAWNVQTFFDAHTDGTEYAEFKNKSSGWNREAYTTRLNRLCDTITSLDADVFVMEEVENSAELYDITNRLAVNSWYKNKTYSYGCFASNPGAAIGCAVLSRYPLCNMTVHSLDIRGGTTQPEMRPLLEVTILKNGKQLVLFVNHWKSKYGGEAKTEIWRNWNEAVLAEWISASIGSSGETNQAILACGDFNRDIAEFTSTGSSPYTDTISVQKPNIAFRGSRAIPVSGMGGSQIGYFEVNVYSPWLDESGSSFSCGSYYYQGKWERIDQFFAAGITRISTFTPESNGDWADENGIPLKYQLWTGKGYSDHLPLSCIVTF